ncbi:hypothetical protein OOK60_10150 [Trichothermofontia sichuanensis B231]|uniref:hypothetical protein n=1 Tax=Trichothermofontia sichuanensis TaxID=3045816 RepID=UPI0022479E6C|nr:hypothetical protein [Trichothermofontia sichuanensis]UZQ52893.1 hypothetical protein OOK60_10150 [Trichothermofontia sichuanensis B231]
MYSSTGLNVDRYPLVVVVQVSPYDSKQWSKVVKGKNGSITPIVKHLLGYLTKFLAGVHPFCTTGRRTGQGCGWITIEDVYVQKNTLYTDPSLPHISKSLRLAHAGKGVGVRTIPAWSVNRGWLPTAIGEERAGHWGRLHEPWFFYSEL